MSESDEEIYNDEDYDENDVDGEYDDNVVSSDEPLPPIVATSCDNFPSTFSDMVKKRSAPKEPSVQQPNRICESEKKTIGHKPVVKVITVKKPRLNESVAPKSGDDDDEDELGINDLTNRELDNKYSHGRTRIRTITRLSASSQRCKDAQIERKQRDASN